MDILGTPRFPRLAKDIRAGAKHYAGPRPDVAVDDKVHITLGKREARGLFRFLGALNAVTSRAALGFNAAGLFHDLLDRLGSPDLSSDTLNLEEVFAGPRWRILVFWAGHRPYNTLRVDHHAPSGKLYFPPADSPPLYFADEATAEAYAEVLRDQVRRAGHKGYTFTVVPA